MSLGAKQDFVFRTQTHLDPKWLKTNLRLAFVKGQGLNQLWNELVKDGEIGIPLGSAEAAQLSGTGVLNGAGALSKKGETGHYYCGLGVLNCSCCDTYCGPHDGCNCGPCQQLEREERFYRCRLRRWLGDNFSKIAWESSLRFESSLSLNCIHASNAD